MDVVEAIVVVPARDEEQRIGACLQALAAQSVGVESFEVVIVLDACGDRTGEVASAEASRHGLSLTLIAGPGAGTGPARRAGMDLACARLRAMGRANGLIASTDADTRPAVDWLERQLAHRAAGAAVIAGRVELDTDEADALPAQARQVREREAAARLRLVRLHDPAAGHHHFAGASLAITAAAYRRAGGLGDEPALEDEAFAERLATAGLAILRAPDVLVTTSARAGGRAARGLSVDLAVARWLASGRRRADQYDLEELRGLRAAGPSVTVILSARECAETIGQVLDRAVTPLRRAGVIDEVVVVDAASRDGTAAVARRHGARVLQQDAIAPELGPAQGKGDAMWRALLATDGDAVCFMDADTLDPDPAHLIGLVGPLLTEPAVAFVKGTFERPLYIGDQPQAHEGGRVTELMARPLLNLHAPLLAGFSQPLAGEFSARRELLEQLPFPVGYGVEVATLYDVLTLRGLDAMVECHLGSRRNRHQSLRALGEMAYAVLTAMERRLPGPRSALAGRFVKPWEQGQAAFVPIVERPPIREWRAGLAAQRIAGGQR
jgi:glucosyl-3-phosphoglycerate synthase